MKYKIILIMFIITVTAQLNRANAELYLLSKDSTVVGSVAVTSVSISVKQHGSYLDITETATITPKLAEIDTGYFMLWEFDLPNKSTIVQLQFTDTSKTYSSRIIPVYQNGKAIDSTLGDPLIELKLIEDDYYYLSTMKNIPLGKSYILSIRYLAPNIMGGTPVFNLSVLARSIVENPKVIEFKYDETDGNFQYALNIGQNSFKLSKGDMLQIPYQTSFQLKAMKNAESMQHVTSFEDGDYKGKYLLFNTSIPDTVLYGLSKPIELVFLWRWNKPTCFLKKNVYGTSSLTPYGSTAILQAKAINEMIETVTFTGNQVGMVHSIQYRKPEVFHLCKKNSAALGVLTGYLSQMNENYFLNSGYYEQDYYPDDPKDTLTDSSRTDFLNSITIVKGLYSNGQGIMKHLIILTCGPIRKTSDIITLEELEPLLKDVSVYSEGSLWKDVSFTNVQYSSLKRELIPMNSFMVPQFRPNSIILQVENSAKKYSFPLAATIPSFSFIAKSDSAWSQNLTWFGFDVKGNPFDTVTTVAKLYNEELDTGLVKLWAADKQRISEKQEKEIEATYGVISSEYSMRIYPTFSDDTIKGFAPVYNYYVKKGPFVNIKNKTEKSGISIFAVRKNTLRIKLTDSKKIRRLKIYSLSGTVIADINPESFVSKFGYYLIPLEKILSSKVSCMVVLKIEAENFCWTKKIFIK